jgi:hypothetical protein
VDFLERLDDEYFAQTPFGVRACPMKYWAPAELFSVARVTLHVNYLFWVRIQNAAPADSHDWYDALPVIESNRY